MMRRRWLNGGGELCGDHHGFETMPADVLRGLGERVPVAPSGNAVAIAQDRIVEKIFCKSYGVAVAPYAVIRTAEELALAQARSGVISRDFKTARLGYDGKGQISVKTADDLAAAWAQLNQSAMRIGAAFAFGF